MQPLHLDDLTPQDIDELEKLYDSTRDVRLRTRAQMVLLAAEQQLTAPQIARIVRKDRQTVRRWLKRYQTDGLDGLHDAPRSGAPGKVTPAYRARLLEVVRYDPQTLGLRHSAWTLKRLAKYLAKETGIRVSYETVRLYLKDAGVTLSDAPPWHNGHDAKRPARHASARRMPSQA